MIQLKDVSKAFSGNVVADEINVTFHKGKSVAILGRNGAGKSTLLKMISGTLSPDRGQIIRKGRISWPVGFAGSFHPDLTGLQNTRFVARIYGVNTTQLESFVKDFSELGNQFSDPVRSYSSGMRSRLAFATSIGLEFDMYLVDEITAVGDIGFKEKCEAFFINRLQTSGAIIVTHGLVQAQKLCQHAAVLEQGTLHYFEDLERGIRFYQKLMKAGKSS